MTHSARQEHLLPSHIWPVRIAAVLLVLQALGVLVLTYYTLAPMGWQERSAGEIIAGLSVDAGTFLICFGPVALLALVGGITLFLRWRPAWLLAVMAQGLLLAGAIDLFFTGPALTDRRPASLYLVMFSCVVLVFYLNTTDVRRAFTARQPALPEEDPDGP